MKSAVLVFPGINRERDMARALKLVSGHEPAMVWHAETALPAGTDLVVVPGGFSYGDYLRCGAIAARAPIMDAVRAFAAKGGLVLGVCNGFQILCESGLLPGVLMRNARLKFICRDVHLRVERADTPFTRGYEAGQVIRVPVAHGEGNYAADADTLQRLEGDGRVLYRYCAADGTVHDDHNINGAAASIAGIVSASGNVLGMMPHPENHVEDIMGCTDGRGLFAGLVQHLGGRLSLDDQDRNRRLKALLSKAKLLAVEYHDLTGKPLGITGEVAEYEAAEKLGLTLSAARAERADGYREIDGKIIHYQIKGRAIPRHNAHRHRVPTILDGDFDFVLLVLLDKINLEPFEIWQAERCAVMARLNGLEGNSARLRRSMAISQFRSIPATLIWSAEDETPLAN